VSVLLEIIEEGAADVVGRGHACHVNALLHRSKDGASTPRAVSPHKITMNVVQFTER
jgi:hypothetical protein